QVGDGLTVGRGIGGEHAAGQGHRRGGIRAASRSSAIASAVRQRTSASGASSSSSIRWTTAFLVGQVDLL
ncbi:MAG TPA: hypothetical protein VNS79_05660, partial [Sphingobium sp.]|nr:hypothetical protein [Sphingobium sp.]